MRTQIYKVNTEVCKCCELVVDNLELLECRVFVARLAVTTLYAVGRRFLCFERP